MLNNIIERMEFEELEDGGKLRVYYRHSYLEATFTADVFFSKQQLQENLGRSVWASDYFAEIGALFSLEDVKTIDFQVFKEVPDEFAGSYNPENPLEVAKLPGRILWVATELR